MQVAIVSTDRIEKQIELKAPVSRVWRALTDYREFGEWFRVKLDGPFVAGASVRGQILHPGYEHVNMSFTPDQIVPESLFSYRWHPNAIDMSVDYSAETPTLVEFRLQATAEGTLLVMVESGFDKVPEHRREIAFRGNDRGWIGQLTNIERYVTGTP